MLGGAVILEGLELHGPTHGHVIPGIQIGPVGDDGTAYGLACSPVYVEHSPALLSSQAITLIGESPVTPHL